MVTVEKEREPEMRDDAQDHPSVEHPADLPDPELAAYDLTPPVQLLPPPGVGANNQSVGVRTGAGDLVWKTYAAHADRDVLLYEHRLLQWLEGAGLSFATPRPLPARDGTTLHGAPHRWRALFPWLAGERPNLRRLDQIEAIGAALGELHAALARYPGDDRPAHVSYGELERVHPQVGEPFHLTPGDLRLPDTAPYDELLGWWRADLAALHVFIEGPYRYLPRQVIHGDFGPANTLILNGRVSAVLDFEFAGPDARALDLASGLVFSMRLWENPNRPWEAARALCRGYARWVRLSEEEIAGLPWLIRLRDAVSVVWWLGRGLVSGDVRPGLERIEQMQRHVAWLEWYGQRLGDLLVRASIPHR